MSTYQPRFTQPFTLAEAIDLDIGILTGEITRLQNSIRHLDSSNVQLKEFVQDPDSVDDMSEFALAIEENEHTIQVQQDRIELIKQALASKVGSEHVTKHFESVAPTARGIDEPTTTVESMQEPSTRTNNSGDGQVENGIEDEGMHL